MAKATLYITITFIVLITVLLIYLIYANFNENLTGGYYGYPPIFNYGTRQTRLMSYDIRGDVPIGYYPVSVFNQPENVSKGVYYYGYEPNFYTPEYVNPWLGVIPSMYNSTFSVPYKVDNNNSTFIKPIVDKPN